MTIEMLNRRMAQAASQTPHLAERRIINGQGKPDARLLLIGEAPGGEEDKQGKPFVGKAGQNLNDFLALIGLHREDIYITNLVKVRPFRFSEKTGKPVNRPPDKEEIAFFSPYLTEEIALIDPAVVVTLGNYPLKAVLNDSSATIGQFHGKPCRANAITLFPLYHPASIIYNQSLKEAYQEDLYALKAFIHSKEVAL